MSFSSLAGSRTLGVGFLICSAFVANVQCKAASEILAVFDKPIQVFGNVSKFMVFVHNQLADFPR
jgi:hypothetical protein